MSRHSPLSGIVAAALLLWGISSFAADPDVLIVDLRINEQPSVESFVLRSEDGFFYVSGDVLDEWQISKPWPRPIVFRGTNYYPLKQFAGATAEFINRSMQLDVTMPPSLMPQRTVDLGRSDMVATSEAFGLYMDYQVNWLNYQNAGHASTNAQLQPIVFSKYGSLRANTLYRHFTGLSESDREFADPGLSVLELTYTQR